MDKQIEDECSHCKPPEPKCGDCWRWTVKCESQELYRNKCIEKNYRFFIPKDEPREDVPADMADLDELEKRAKLSEQNLTLEEYKPPLYKCLKCRTITNSLAFAQDMCGRNVCPKCGNDAFTIPEPKSFSVRCADCGSENLTHKPREDDVFPDENYEEWLRLVTETLKEKGYDVVKRSEGENVG